MVIMTGHTESWDQLTSGLQRRLIDQPDRILTADEVVELARAGQPPVLTYWADLGTNDERFWLSSSFRRFVELRRADELDRRVDDYLRPLVEQAKIPLDWRDADLDQTLSEEEARQLAGWRREAEALRSGDDDGTA